MYIRLINFHLQHPKFIVDCVILSVSSAVGQLFIFYTIATFGPVVFTIIMTVRQVCLLIEKSCKEARVKHLLYSQAIAILLSCVVYQHHISKFGIFGVFIVFVAIFLRVYCNQRLKSIRRRAENAHPLRLVA